MLDQLMHSENIVHIGAILYLAGFLFRDQLTLRGLIIAGDFVYILYFYFAPETPLWGGIFWSVMFTIANIWMIGVIVAERMHFRLSPIERRLFDLLESLSPGQFRDLIRIGTSGIATAPVTITAERLPLDRLYFVLDGTVLIEKNGRQALTAPQTFIGEIAFLLARPATATVSLEPGASYFVWESAALRALLEAKPALNHALTSAMNKKLAQKVANAGVSTF
ncbi:MAG: hypothetical protein ACK50Q_07945 [Labrys sp. (in: a-proteobacteria)]|jgi:hypothetical protein